jgi:hypothetical protein
MLVAVAPINIERFFEIFSAEKLDWVESYLLSISSTNSFVEA